MTDNARRRGRVPRRALPAIAVLVLLTGLYSLLVYVVPTLSEQTISGSYDAFSYALGMVEEPELLREQQPFLRAYPAALSTGALPIYGTVLHLVLLVPSLALAWRLRDRRFLSVLLAALAVPESAIFLGAVSKEALAIIAVGAALTGQMLYFEDRFKTAFLLTVYAVAIAEFSRPGFGAAFAVAALMAYVPILRPQTRKMLIFFAVVSALVGAWALLAGPLHDWFSQTYETARTFLFWFEENLGSDSPAKNAVRYFFTIAFGREEPTWQTLALVTLMAVVKAATYVLALPLIAPSNFTDMPAQTWALTWEFASSISTFVVAHGAWRIYRNRSALSVPDRSRLWFGFTLLFLIAASTAIFHVRYRAPAIVAILVALWMAQRRSQPLVAMTIPSLAAACWAILTT